LSMLSLSIADRSSSLPAERKKKLQDLRLFLGRVKLILERKQKANSPSISDLHGIISKLSYPYEKAKTETRKQLLDWVMREPKLFTPTVCEIMGSDAVERVHSNILAHLLNHKRIGKTLLMKLLQKVADKNGNASVIIGSLGSTEFQAIREYPIKGKRIDILIRGVVGERFVVVVENKVRAPKHYIDETTSQTDFYMREIREQYPDSRVVFFILDFKGEELSEGYYSLDYTDLEDALEGVTKDFPEVNEDHIFQEYLYLLKRLVRGITMTTDQLQGLESLVSLDNMWMEVKFGAQERIA
jgi:hypothetical protein